MQNLAKTVSQVKIMKQAVLKYIDNQNQFSEFVMDNPLEAKLGQTINKRTKLKHDLQEKSSTYSFTNKTSSLKTNDSASFRFYVRNFQNKPLKKEKELFSKNKNSFHEKYVQQQLEQMPFTKIEKTNFKKSFSNSPHKSVGTVNKGKRENFEKKKVQSIHKRLSSNIIDYKSKIYQSQYKHNFDRLSQAKSVQDEIIDQKTDHNYLIRKSQTRHEEPETRRKTRTRCLSMICPQTLTMPLENNNDNTHKMTKLNLSKPIKINPKQISQKPQLTQKLKFKVQFSQDQKQTLSKKYNVLAQRLDRLIQKVKGECIEKVEPKVFNPRVSKQRKREAELLYHKYSPLKQFHRIQRQIRLKSASSFTK